MLTRNCIGILLSGAVLSGCAASEETIQEFGTQSQSTQWEARTAMLAGDSTRASELYTQAALQLDPTDETYVDGYFYLDRARMHGNKAVMALFDGDEDTARDYFGVSERTLRDGVSQHQTVLQERENVKQGIATVAAVGLSVALGVVGARAQANATDALQLAQFQNDTNRALQLTASAYTDISQHLAEIHEIEIEEEARHLDWDIWRSAVISDHPLSQAIVRLESGSGGLCTGFFIQPRVIATAAHCFARFESVTAYKMDPRSRQDFLQGGLGSRLTTLATYQPDEYTDAIDCNINDVALIVVAESSEQWLDIDLAGVEKSAKGMIIGYSGDLDRGYFQRMDYGCELTSEGDHQIGSNCATAGGNSGGPVFKIDHSDDGLSMQVVGVHVCGPANAKGNRTLASERTAVSLHRLASIYQQAMTENQGAGDANLFN